MRKAIEHIVNVVVNVVIAYNFAVIDTTIFAVTNKPTDMEPVD